MVNIATIETYLKQYGWDFQRPENEIITTSFIAEDIENGFLLVIQLALPWLRFSIPAYMPMPNDNLWVDFSKKLLEINYASRQVYFAISESNSLTLCVDLYVEYGINFENFETALDAITYVAEAAYSPLMNLINSTVN